MTLSAALGAVLAVEEYTLVAGGAVAAVFGFATLLVREVLKQHRTLWELIDAARDDAHYARWELEVHKFRHGERELDPGPYSARTQHKEQPRG